MSCLFIFSNLFFHEINLLCSVIKLVLNVWKGVKYRDRLVVFMLAKNDAIRNHAIRVQLSQRSLAIVA